MPPLLGATTDRELVALAVRLSVSVPVAKCLIFYVYLIVTGKLDPLERLE